MNTPKERRHQRTAQREAKRRKRQAIAGVLVPDEAPVNVALLAPTNSYGRPDFVLRGFYKDLSFVCKGCGAMELWKATQQKWWYEIAKGDMFTLATRCRSCRRKERARRNEVRTKHVEGLARKGKSGVG